MIKRKETSTENGPIRAARYVRMSTDHQQYSIDNQSAAIDTYAQEHHMEIVRTYSDAGKTGLTLEDRPGLRRLLEDVEAGAPGYSVVLVRRQPLGSISGCG